MVSPNYIHQCSDFRLCDFRVGLKGRWIPIEDNSPKIVTLTYAKWSGTLTYCGVGKWSGKATNDWVAEWIETLGPNATFEEVVEILTARGSDWIDQIRSALRKFQSHSFILGGFEDSRPRIAIISNTHSTRGHISPRPTQGLQASLEADSGSHVYVTGLDSTVSKADRIHLKRMADENEAPNVVRHKLAQVIETASKKAEANNGISVASLCHSHDSLGGGSGGTHGKVDGPLVPKQLMRGKNFEKMLRDSGLIGSQSQVKQIAFATGASSDAVAAKQIHCRLEQLQAQGSYELIGHDIGSMNERGINITSANDQLVVVGSTQQPIGSAPRAFRWLYGKEIEELRGMDGGNSSANDVNIKNIVVGNCTNAQNESRAVLWQADGSLTNLGVVGANNSKAAAINDQEIVAGEVWQSPASKEGDFHSAFVWSNDNGMKLIETGSAWSTALDINEGGEILGMCGPMGQWRSFVWSPIGGLHLIPPDNGRPFFASCFNDFGIVAGEADDANGVRRAMIWDSTNGLRELNVPFAFHPKAIDNLGNIVGFDEVRPWSGAWLVTENGLTMPIPGGADHNVEAHVIVKGAIFGHSRKGDWKHVHPIRWEMKQ